jgi:hypothetical protein
MSLMMKELLEETTALYHLIYRSSAVERLPQSEMIELLKISRRKNEARELTGMLLYRDGTYLQFLEGKRRDIGELLDRLRKDPRHNAIRIIREGTLPERLFPEWSMAFKNLAGLRSSHVPGYSERLQGHYVNDGGRDPEQLLVEMFREVMIADYR